MDMSLKNEDSKSIKLRVQLIEEELINYKILIIKYSDVFSWFYKDFKNNLLEIA